MTTRHHGSPLYLAYHNNPYNPPGKLPMIPLRVAAQPVSSGWLLYSSFLIHRPSIAACLSECYCTKTQNSIQVASVWGDVPIADNFQSTSTWAILIKVHPRHKTKFQLFLHDLLLPSSFSHSPSQYPFQRASAFVSPEDHIIPPQEHARPREDNNKRFFDVPNPLSRLAPLTPFSMIPP